MADQVRIKSEADVDSPMADDELDDAGDLEFFDTNNPDNPLGKLYLTRLPNYVWQAWDSLDDDAEIQIGTVRLWSENGKVNAQSLATVSTTLTSCLGQAATAPQEQSRTAPAPPQGIQPRHRGPGRAEHVYFHRARPCQLCGNE